MHPALKKIGRTLLRAIPENRMLCLAAKHYADRCNGDNNSDFNTNGERDLLNAVLPSCRTVFDVGANNGDWAALALQVNPRLNIHCFEPSPATFSHLCSRGFPPNVVCNNVGLGSKAEEATLFVFEEGAGINSLYRRTGLEDRGLGPQHKQEVVRLKTLPDYCHEHGVEQIDFLKLDIEGHEHEVLKGMAAWLREGRVGLIQLEYGGCNIDAGVLLKDLWELMQPYPYSFHKIYPGSLRKIERYNQSLETFQHQNWALINEGRLRVA